MVAAGPVMAACSSGPTYDQWAATDGAAGRINLDDVQEAFKDSKSPTDFERRANEISTRVTASCSFGPNRMATPSFWRGGRT